ncbi:hypothetical protein Lal_00012571 [Lupinus albus]|uniref:Uncharacterized protein n=1 Tax=Lupinus albus TaxID=3870 RepID=A0A6A4NDI3_LUPAL|nr:hypothetical protein Lalb_Chr22g0359891 [Lupinus albus]KAF1883654.1 hypothetical protein Lal_00012571 [Lupinus albus]
MLGACTNHVPVQVSFNNGEDLNPNIDNQWWSRGFMKVREWSKIIVGRCRKNFIHQFNRNRSINLRTNGKFQYDPLSYALNFEEGSGKVGDFEDEGYHGIRNFSTRYASTISTKSVSTDAG